MSTPTGVLPVEIWHIICGHLVSHDVLLSLRLTSKSLADISAEFLITEIRIDTSTESFERLKAIADHDLLRKGVHKLTYEAGLLGDIRCIHSYMSHYDLDHHRAQKPSPPSASDNSDRASRLYARNIAKYNQELHDRYDAYRVAFDAQQTLLETPKALIFDSVDRLINLDHIVFRTDASCVHSVSPIFRQKFGKDCAVPISGDSTPTTRQLEKILCPSHGLKRLCARQISPKLFNNDRSQDWFRSVFSNLESVQLMFRPDRETLDADSIAGDPIGSKMLDNTHLAYALGTAQQNLRSLTVNFGPSVEQTAGTLLNIMGNNTFRSLRHLDLDFFSTTEEYFLHMLKSQPKLNVLYIACATLTDGGNWANIVRDMRDELSDQLDEVYCNGFFEDSDGHIFSTEVYEREAWVDGMKISLSSAINMYVTDPDYPIPEDELEEEVVEDFDLLFNPIRRIEEDFEEEDELTLEFGSLSGKDDEDDTSHEDDASNDDADGVMPALDDAPEPMNVD